MHGNVKNYVAIVKKVAIREFWRPGWNVIKYLATRIKERLS